ncbi:MAG: hypothetical protein DRQ51_09045 [Gammaproteobacteria bacterium]|nr:MAG: hypothetical protein DRQ51_09045 [Gammaproteobacteria bacterium]
MSDIIITNIITAGASIVVALIVAYFAYAGNKEKNKLKVITKRSRIYLEEIKIFYELEKEYIKAIQNLNSNKDKKRRGAKSIKQEMRDKLTYKPTFTTNQINKTLRTFDRYI